MPEKLLESGMIYCFFRLRFNFFLVATFTFLHPMALGRVTFSARISWAPSSLGRGIWLYFRAPTWTLIQFLISGHRIRIRKTGIPCSVSWWAGRAARCTLCGVRCTKIGRYAGGVKRDWRIRWKKIYSLKWICITDEVMIPVEGIVMDSHSNDYDGDGLHDSGEEWFDAYQYNTDEWWDIWEGHRDVKKKRRRILKIRCTHYDEKISSNSHEFHMYENDVILWKKP